MILMADVLSSINIIIVGSFSALSLCRYAMSSFVKYHIYIPK
jgi:hypothetical protein